MRCGAQGAHCLQARRMQGWAGPGTSGALWEASGLAQGAPPAGHTRATLPLTLKPLPPSSILRQAAARSEATGRP